MKIKFDAWIYKYLQQHIPGKLTRMFCSRHLLSMAQTVQRSRRGQPVDRRRKVSAGTMSTRHRHEPRVPDHCTVRSARGMKVGPTIAERHGRDLNAERKMKDRCRAVLRLLFYLVARPHRKMRNGVACSEVIQVNGPISSAFIQNKK